MVATLGTASRPLTILCDCVARGNVSCLCHEYVLVVGILSRANTTSHQNWNAACDDSRIQSLYVARSNKVTMYHVSEIQRFLQPSSRSCETTARQATSRSLPERAK